MGLFNVAALKTTCVIKKPILTPNVLFTKMMESHLVKKLYPPLPSTQNLVMVAVVFILYLVLIRFLIMFIHLFGFLKLFSYGI